jgi:GTP pyrophosphokinase
MKILENEQFTSEELNLFLTDYRKLYSMVGEKLSVNDWRLIKQYILKGIDAGFYGRDVHGIHQLVHTLETCRVLLEQVGLGRRSILTVLLYPLAEHKIISKEEMDKAFGSEVVRLVSYMAKVQHLYADHDNLEDENFSKLMLSFAQDIRVIICMICDRYTLMKALNHNPDVEYRHKVTQECRLLYTPIAHRLGLYLIKGEMEDMAVKYDYRDVYDDIAHQLQQTKKAREEYIQQFITPLEARLKEVLPVPFHIKGRTKSIASIWSKMKKQQNRLDQIYDLFAIRIIIDAEGPNEKALCWQAYSVVTDMYQPNPKRLKDWLSIPKSNGYESLHITVYGPGERWVEVQIRTKRMDEIAERGLAAHWKYKGIKSEGNSADQLIASIREVLESGAPKDDLVKDFSMGLYNEEVFVFTPNGDVHKFPKGATVLDFAFSIHTKLGMQCVGARVGGKNVKINHQLKSGETVEIITSSQQTPKLDWLNIVKTSKARSRIKSGIKEIQNREAQTGKELLQRRFKNRKIELDEAEMSRVIIKLGYKTQTEFYHDLSVENISVDEVLKEYELLQTPQIQGEPATHSAADFTATPETAVSPDKNQAGSDVLVIDRDLKGIDYKLANCCHPIYGDEIVGFVSIARGITIHRADCANIRSLAKQYPYRIQRARWSGKSAGQYYITLRVVGNDDIGIVTNISSVINKEPNTLLRSISIDTEGGLFQGHLTVSVSDLSSLNLLIRKIQSVKGVKNVSRTN